MFLEKWKVINPFFSFITGKKQTFNCVGMAQQILHNIRPKQIICDQNIQSCYRLLIDPVAIQNQRKKSFHFNLIQAKKQT